MRRPSLRVFTMCLLAGIACLPALASGYSITDLGRFSTGGGGCVISDMNMSGQVVGQAAHAFVFTPGSGMADLGTLPGDTSSTAYGINNLGQVVGVSSRMGSQGAVQRVFLYTPGVGMSVLDVGAGSNRVTPFDINNAGQVVGLFSSGLNPSHSFLYTPGSGMVEISYGKTALAVSQSGWVLLANDSLYIPGTGTVDIGADLGGYDPRAVNDLGQIALGGYGHAGVYDYRSHSFISLGTLGGDYSSAHAIDNNGRVAGFATDASGATHIVVWTIPEPSCLLAVFAGLGGFCAVTTGRRRGRQSPR